MSYPQLIITLENRLDYLIKKTDGLEDLYFQSQMGRHLAILTAGYFEKSIQSIVSEFARRHSRKEIARFVERRMSREWSINREKLKKITEEIDKELFLKIEGNVGDDAKSAVDSIKNIRDQLSHGEDNGTSYGVIRDYHFKVRQYVNVVREQFESFS